MHVVRAAGYPSRFNTPRRSRHRISTRRWLPAHKIWRPLEVALLMPDHGADLLACFNRIPLGSKPFVVSFESHLPRLFGYEGSRAFRAFSRILAGDRCRAIVPISGWARRMFLAQHAGSQFEEALARKLAPVIYPSVEVPSEFPGEDRTGEELSVVFLGGHFGRKGGPALLLAAERAHREGLPIRVDIVSDLTFGRENGAWTDLPAAEFARYRQHLALPNVVHHGRLPNAAAMALLRRADVLVLPTLSDTFGYSAIETLAAGTAVVATAANALPEIVRHGETGHLVDLETDGNGEWIHLFSLPPDSPRYRRIWADTMERLGDDLFDALAALAADPARLASMKRAAHADALARFDAGRQGAILDDLYEAALGGDTAALTTRSTAIAGERH